MRTPRKHQGQDGHTFFITTVVRDRYPIFKDPKAATIACEIIENYRKLGDFYLGEFVIMPDHIHLIITPRKRGLSDCMRVIKRTISQKIHEMWGRNIPAPQLEKNLWQSSFHDRRIKTDAQLSIFSKYIVENPLRANLENPKKQYLFSSRKKETDRNKIAVGSGFDVHQTDLFLATTNKGKIIEIRKALSDLDVAIFSPEDFFIETSPKEEGSTFEENALQKARYYRSFVDIPILADDSGIIVEALENELGIHTRRWGAGPDATDEEWISYFLNRMKTAENKRARFVCVLALLDKSGSEHLFRGTCDGVITDALEADYLPGLPISGCFKPDGYADVYSAMKIEQKNSASHRGKAVLELRKHLELNNAQY